MRAPETGEVYELMRRLAIEHAWGAIETASLDEIVDGVEWLDLGSDLDSCSDDVRLLAALGLLEVHPKRPELVREVGK